MDFHLNVKQCSLCQGFTEYYCHSCQKDLCQQCKAVHVINLYTSHHKVTIYREKFKYIQKREHCVIHCDRIYNKYCKPRGVPVCDSCSVHKPRGPTFLAYFYPRKHSEHKLVCLKTAYKTTRQRREDWIQKVRSETLYRGSCDIEETQIRC